MTDRICVSIFVCENADGSIAIKSLAADDHISKAIERMTCEQIENLLKYMSAAVEAAHAIKAAGAKLDEAKPV